LGFPRSNSIQNTQNHTKSSPTDPCRLTEIHHRQAVHQRNPKNRVAVLRRLAVQGLTVRRFLQGTQEHQTGMCRLVAMSNPPGGFWKNPRNADFNAINQKVKHIHSMIIQLRIKKTQIESGKTPLTWNSFA